MAWHKSTPRHSIPGGLIEFGKIRNICNTTLQMAPLFDFLNGAIERGTHNTKSSRLKKVNQPSSFACVDSINNKSWQNALHKESLHAISFALQ
jgi:hypothetical protein